MTTEHVSLQLTVKPDAMFRYLKVHVHLLTRLAELCPPSLERDAVLHNLRLALDEVIRGVDTHAGPQQRHSSDVLRVAGQEIDRLNRQCCQLQSLLHQLFDKRNRSQDQQATLMLENYRLQTVLEQVEYTPHIAEPGGVRVDACPLCKAGREEGHLSTCPIGQALHRTPRTLEQKLDGVMRRVQPA